MERFWRTLLGGATEQEKQAWQEIIASSSWSSHMIVICRKPYKLALFSIQHLHPFVMYK